MRHEDNTIRQFYTVFSKNKWIRVSFCLIKPFLWTITENLQLIIFWYLLWISVNIRSVKGLWTWGRWGGEAQRDRPALTSSVPRPWSQTGLSSSSPNRQTLIKMIKPSSEHQPVKPLSPPDVWLTRNQATARRAPIGHGAARPTQTRSSSSTDGWVLFILAQISFSGLGSASRRDVAAELTGVRAGPAARRPQNGAVANIQEPDRTAGPSGQKTCHCWLFEL